MHKNEKFFIEFWIFKFQLTISVPTHIFLTKMREPFEHFSLMAAERQQRSEECKHMNDRKDVHRKEFAGKARLTFFCFSNSDFWFDHTIEYTPA